LSISVTSAGRVTTRREPPYFVLIDRALRDEGTSVHYEPPAKWSRLAESLRARLVGAVVGPELRDQLGRPAGIVERVGVPLLSCQNRGMEGSAKAAQRGAGPAPITVEELLEDARAGLPRLAPQQAHQAAEAGAALIDIRSDTQRLDDGEIACATRIPRNVLEWRLDPACPHRCPELARRDLVVIVLCDEGYQSSLAAATLRRFGLDVADVVGGFQAWRAAGLPVER